MKIRTQFTITMSLFGLVLVMIAISLIITNRQVDWLSRQQLIAQNIERDARELSYLSNDYLLYRESQQRGRWESKFASFSEDVARLSPNTPEQQALVTGIEANQERLKAVFSDVVSTLEGTAQTSETPGMAFVQVSWSRLEVQNQSMVFDAQLLSQKLHAETDQLDQTNDVLILALIGLLGAYFVANYSLIYRHALNSIAELQEGTKIIGSGNLDFAIPAKATDEIGELARAFNRMTANLKEVTASKADLEREIAERKKVEQAVRQSEALLRAVLDNSPDPIFLKDRNSRLLLANLATFAVIGKPAEAVLGKTDAEFYDDAAAGRAIMENDQRIMHSGQMEVIEETVVVAEGPRTYLSSKAPYRDAEGRIIGLIGVAREITARKRAEEALRASEERYRSLFESINEGFALHEIICDPLGRPIDYRFLEINPAFERLTGLERDKIIGQTVRSVMPAIEDYWIHAYGQVALTGAPAHFENYSSELGQYYEVFAHRPAPGQFAVLFLNITERKQAEERIQKLNHALEQQAEALQQINIQLEETLAEEQVAREEAEAGRNVLESLMHYAPEVILIAEAPDARIRMVSQYAEAMTGRPLAQLLGLPTGAHPESQDLFQQDGTTPMAFEELPLVRAVKRGETVLDYEMVLRRPDGARRTIVANAGPIRDAHGNVTGGIAVWRDITVRKQIELQVQKLNRDLERRAVELEIANRELESFSYSVSHDLRTPLASIDGFANLLLKDCGAQLPPDGRRYLELIRSNSTEMNQLIEGLLAFSRFIRQPLRKQTVDLDQLVRQALEDLRGQQQGRRVEFDIGPLPACEADPVLLKQVLINLLSNALKFTRRREVAHIEIKATQTDDGEILYAVRDNGVGFDPEQADHLFGVFQRLHSQEDYEGTGVGLAIVERIIKRHGGRVCAEGQVDHGATFYFTLD